MERSKTVDEYISNHQNWKREITFLRAIALNTSFTETIKWGVPTYTINGKNVVGIGAFKNYVGLWFFNGSFLKDTQNKLINAQEGKTKGLRQWRFLSLDEMDESLILEYLNEAIENQKAGKTIKITRGKPVVIPPELQKILDENKELKSFFEGFTNSKQREFADHIADAKRDATKGKRLEKIIPMILSGVGLHDKYKNC
ncbi:MAG: YdeI/OmpD-associated family protein [Urechidicola sp.]|nr:YdeI/OmpD-associated family protein [Urechidicola sp.]